MIVYQRVVDAGIPTAKSQEDDSVAAKLAARYAAAGDLKINWGLDCSKAFMM